MSLSRFLSRSLPVERLLDPDDPGAAGGGRGHDDTHDDMNIW